MGMLDPRADLASFDWATRAAELERLQEALNPADAVDMAEDKRRFGELCERHGLAAGRQVAVLERRGGPEETAAAWAAALEHTAPDGLVVKPVDGHRGLGVRVLERAPGGAQDHRGRAVGWDELARDLAAEPWPGYVVQERLRTHPDLARLSGHGLLHTMRLVTLRDEGGDPRMIGAILRVAEGREPVELVPGREDGEPHRLPRRGRGDRAGVGGRAERLRLPARADAPPDRGPPRGLSHPRLGGRVRPGPAGRRGLRPAAGGGLRRGAHARRPGAGRGQRVVELDRRSRRRARPGGGRAAGGRRERGRPPTAGTMITPWERPLRIARRLRGAAAAHDARLWRVGARAVRLRSGGWRLGEAASFGLLDPAAGLGGFPWAIPATEMERLQEALNPEDAARRAEDKRHLAAICARHGLPTIPQAAVLERAGDAATTAAAWARALERDAPDELVVKPVDAHRGLGLRALTRVPGGAADDRGRVIGWGPLAGQLAAEPWPGYVVQERLRPHPDLARMSDTAIIHTLRMVTLRPAGGGPARLIASRLRIPAGHLPVNSFRAGRSGNLVAEVRADGTLALPYGPLPSGFGLQPVPRHPRSDVPMEWFQVPGWQDACALALRAAEAFAPLRALGLDLAPTADGPVVVEANAWWRWLPNPAGGADPAFAALRAAAAGR